ncbi:aminotransferase class I/II-fold pyridoxal phosphate-dependent enzyme [Ruminococcaceae bacterium OttesenSCG-928-A11]|nr:aminotransferase class I/II-fold pyridoxal phosphate-dependent enzyme [Ruminococcaceae bacterium OttesenSCG-928-A11]
MEYSKLISKGAREMRPSGIRKFFDIAAEMDDVITLGVGEPDFDTPWVVRQAGIKSLEEGRTFYTSNAGMIELRQEIAGYMKKFSLDYDPAGEIVITVGGSEAIDAALRALVDPGDEVLIPEPSFVCYHPITTLVGGVPVPIPLKNEDGFRLTPEALKAAITPKTKVLVFPYPCNPTGGVMRREHLEPIAEILRDTGITVLSDEIYAELTYGGVPHVSIASLPGMAERTVVVNGFSKTYAMTGWRLGYACGPRDLMAAVNRIHQSAIMCAPTMAQYAAIVALRDCDADVAAMREEYDRRRKFLMGKFKELELPCFEPEGAFYVFPDIRSTGLDSGTFCERLLMEHRVAMVPGTAFGDSGEGFVRISYAYSLEHLSEAMDRLAEFLKKVRG